MGLYHAAAVEAGLTFQWKYGLQLNVDFGAHWQRHRCKFEQSMVLFPLMEEEKFQFYDKHCHECKSSKHHLFYLQLLSPS
jgi:hypothetical protein